MESYSLTIQMKATEQYFHMVLFILRNKVVHLILKCFRSNESFGALVLVWCGAVLNIWQNDI